LSVFLLSLNLVYCQQTCPAYADIYPCRCFQLSATQSQIECTGKNLNEVDIYAIGSNIKGRIQELYIHDTKIGIIPANIFPNVVFTTIVIEDNDDLKLIDPHAFKTGTMTKLIVRRNKSFNSPLIYDLARNLNPTDTVQLDGNSIEELPTNAFTPLNPTTNKLKKIYLNNNKIKTILPHAFTGLPMLTTVSIDGNELEIINPNGLDFTASETQRQISVRLGSNKISATSFHRGAIVVPENVTLSLQLEDNEMKQLPEFEFSYLEQPGNQIVVTGNAITCDCSLRWIFTAIQRSNVLGLKCANLGSRDINQLTVSDVCV
jgi:Leucine-rich repeat (LRR) protein